MLKLLSKQTLFFLLHVEWVILKERNELILDYVYIPPEGSPYIDTEHFQEIINDVYNELMNILMEYILTNEINISYIFLSTHCGLKVRYGDIHFGQRLVL